VSYEDDVARVQSIVAELEGDEVELERALALFQEGVERLRAAAAALAHAESQVRLLVEQPDGSFGFAPFAD
jgi:exodeoxyribonuclease VII small subunit